MVHSNFLYQERWKRVAPSKLGQGFKNLRENGYTLVPSKVNSHFLKHVTENLANRLHQTSSRYERRSCCNPMQLRNTGVPRVGNEPTWTQREIRHGQRRPKAALFLLALLALALLSVFPTLKLARQDHSAGTDLPHVTR